VLQNKVKSRLFEKYRDLLTACFLLVLKQINHQKAVKFDEELRYSYNGVHPGLGKMESYGVGHLRLRVLALADPARRPRDTEQSEKARVRPNGIRERHLTTRPEQFLKEFKQTI